MTRSIWLLLLVGWGALLGGCGGGASIDGSTQPLKKLAVELDGFPDPEAAGITMAKERGYFKDAGLAVEINIPAGARAPIPYVLGGTADLSVTHEPQLVLAQERGAPVTAFGSLVSQPTAALIWLKKAGIESIAGLKGKTIGTEGLRFQRAFLESILARAGMTLADVKVVNAEYYLVRDLAAGKVDAVIGGSGNVEGIELEKRGLEPVVTPLRDLGIPAYDELVTITRSEGLSEEGEELRAFMSAVLRGVAAAARDPKGAVSSIKHVGALDPFFEFNRDAMEAGLEATLPLLSTNGELSVDQASELVDWMHGEGMIKRKPPVSALLTNQFVP